MRSNTSFFTFQTWQQSIYKKLNSFAKKHENIGRLGSFPVSLLDTSLGVINCPVTSIQALVFATINFIGIPFSSKYTLKDTLYYIEYSLNLFAVTFPTAAMFPIKCLYQTFAIALDPIKSRPFYIV